MTEMMRMKMRLIWCAVSGTLEEWSGSGKGTYGDCCLVHRAATLGEEDVHQDGHDDGSKIHSHG